MKIILLTILFFITSKIYSQDFKLGLTEKQVLAKVEEDETVEKKFDPKAGKYILIKGKDVQTLVYFESLDTSISTIITPNNTKVLDYYKNLFTTKGKRLSGQTWLYNTKTANYVINLNYIENDSFQWSFSVSKY